ncbi:MAG: glycosyltransferase family protein [Candidatus Kuenenbacteria bacterium]
MNICILQARMGSTRLPGKVLKKINGTPLLAYQIKRVKQSKKIKKIIIATAKGNNNNPIEKLCRTLKIDCFRGSENDVLARYYECSLSYPKYQSIVRLTGDCPLIDPIIIDQVIDLFEKLNCDYASNVPMGKETYPDGMDVEVFKKTVIATAHCQAILQSDREHVNEYILRNRKFRKKYLQAGCDFSHFRLTVDNSEDFEVIKFLIKNSKITAGYLDYISLLTKNPHIMLKNMHIKRNQGYFDSLKKDKIYGKKN